MNKIVYKNRQIRKRVALTLRQKIDICQLLEKGVSRNEIMKIYNVGSSTIYDIKAQKEHILKFIADSDCIDTLDNRKNLRKPKLEQLDSLLYGWYKVMHSDGLPITGRKLMEKAREFHQHLNPNEQCHFSGGWLARFKIRHGIKRSDGTDDVKCREGSDDEFEVYHQESKMSYSEPEITFEDYNTAADEAQEEESEPNSSRSQPWLPKLQPILPEVTHNKSFQESTAHWFSPVHHTPISSQYSYTSHPLKLSGASTTSTQPTFEDSTLSLFLSETRMQNAEMRVAMGQLTDKMDNIMNMVNQLSQHQCRKWWQTPTAFQEDDGDKGDDWSGDENCHKITKVKLLARIISMEEKCEILEKENVSLKKDLQNTSAKLVEFETDQFERISENVKTAMYTVYSEIEAKFLNGVEYEGSDIRNIVASTIKELTEELDGETVEENVELDSSKRMKLGKSSTIGKRKRKAMVQDKPASSTKVSQKDSETVDFATVASTNPMEIEVAAENPESDPGGGWKQTFQKPSDFLESTMILQDGEVITIKEENCSIASREGSEERVIGPEPPSPPILDAGELSESGEEWLPT